MNVKKTIVLCMLFFSVSVFLYLTGILSRFGKLTEGTSDKRVTDYIAGSENAEKYTDGIQQKLGEVESQMRTAGNEITECVTELGELQNDSDRITEAGRGIAVTAERIERRILVCLQILGIPEKDEELLEENSPGLYDPGGR